MRSDDVIPADLDPGRIRPGHPSLQPLGGRGRNLHVPSREVRPVTRREGSDLHFELNETVAPNPHVTGVSAPAANEGLHRRGTQLRWRGCALATGYEGRCQQQAGKDSTRPAHPHNRLPSGHILKSFVRLRRRTLFTLLTSGNRSIDEVNFVDHVCVVVGSEVELDCYSRPLHVGRCRRYCDDAVAAKVCGPIKTLLAASELPLPSSGLRKERVDRRGVSHDGSLPAVARRPRAQQTTSSAFPFGLRIPSRRSRIAEGRITSSCCWLGRCRAATSNHGERQPQCSHDRDHVSLHG